METAPGKRYNSTQSALSRVLYVLAMEGLIARGEPAAGSWLHSQYRWASMGRWLPGGIDGADPEQAATELARRWLASFGPATATDLQWWMGWTARANGQGKRPGRWPRSGWPRSDELHTTLSALQRLSGALDALSETDGANEMSAARGAAAL